MFTTLTEIYKQKDFVALYTDYNDSSKFIYGQIINLNKDEIAIYTISPEGYFDGIVAKKTTDIMRIDLGGRYINKMKKLMSLHGLEISECLLDKDHIFQSLLLLAKDSIQIVSLELLNSGYTDVTGFIANIEDGLCCIKQVDLFGIEDGVSFVKMNDITQISYSSNDEITIYELWESN